MKTSRTLNYGIMQGNWEGIDAAMNALTEELNEEGWEIKAVLPLVASEYSTEGLTNNTAPLQSAWGAGIGYGASFSDGVVLLCQKAIHLTDEEFAERQFAINKTRTENRRQAERQEEVDRIRSEPIISKSKGVFKGSTYFYDEVEYETEAEAVVARETKAIARTQQK